jgi:hypothetical protein
VVAEMNFMLTWRPSEVLMSGRMTGMQKLRHELYQ